MYWGAAAVALTVSTWRLAGAALIAGGASLGGELGKLIGKCITLPCGPITAVGAKMVLIKGIPAARTFDTVMCTGPPPYLSPHPGSPIAQGSKSVIIEGQFAARVGDKLSCGASIGEGEASVIVGGPQTTVLDIDGEVPGWANAGLLILGIAGLAGGGWILFSRHGLKITVYTFLGGLVGGKIGEKSGGWISKQLGYGEGTPEHDLATFGGSVFGAGIGAKYAFRKGTASKTRPTC